MNGTQEITPCILPIVRTACLIAIGALASGTTLSIIRNSASNKGNDGQTDGNLTTIDVSRACPPIAADTIFGSWNNGNYAVQARSNKNNTCETIVDFQNINGNGTANTTRVLCLQEPICTNGTPSCSPEPANAARRIRPEATANKKEAMME